MRFLAIVALTVAGLFCLCASPSYAQATRTWVSGVGDDANPCSRTAPCKTFAGAISKTATTGEINCLDPAGFGALTITKAITILCDSASNGGVLVSGTNGITVVLPSAANVVLSGLDFEGSGTGLIGISMTGPGKLTVRNSSIRDFSQAGISVAGPSTGPASARVYVINTLITNNNIGVKVAPASGVSAFATLVNTTVDANTAAAVQAIGSSAKVTLENSQLTGSPAAIDPAGTTPSIISVGPSNFFTGTAPTPTTQAFQ